MGQAVIGGRGEGGGDVDPETGGRVVRRDTGSRQVARPGAREPRGRRVTAVVQERRDERGRRDVAVEERDAAHEELGEGEGVLQARRPAAGRVRS